MSSLEVCFVGILGLILLGFMVALLTKRTCPRCGAAAVKTHYFSDMGGNVRLEDAERDWLYCPSCGWSNRDGKTREERRGLR